ncbi:hypothetical protein E4T56_gene583, partial [Termitomyces sp. T112]
MGIATAVVVGIVPQFDEFRTPPSNSDTSLANPNGPLANSDIFSTATNASPSSPEPLEPSPTIPDSVIHHQPITLVPSTHSRLMPGAHYDSFGLAQSAKAHQIMDLTPNAPSTPVTLIQWLSLWTLSPCKPNSAPPSPTPPMPPHLLCQLCLLPKVSGSTDHRGSAILGKFLLGKHDSLH